MRNKGRILVLLVGTLLYNMTILLRYQEPSLNLLLKGAYPGTDYFGEVFWFFWFACVSFYFLGVIEDRFLGYGVYELIRGANRIKMILKVYGNVAVQLLILTVGQVGQVGITMILSVAVNVGIVTMAPITFVQCFVMYLFTIYVLILIQLFLELYTKPQIAMLLLNVYVIFSNSLGGVLYKIRTSNGLLYGLISNFAMAQRTSIMNKDVYTIHWQVAIWILGILLCCVVLLSIWRIKKKDFI